MFIGWGKGAVKSISIMRSFMSVSSSSSQVPGPIAAASIACERQEDEEEDEDEFETAVKDWFEHWDAEVQAGDDEVEGIEAGEIEAPPVAEAV